MSVQQRKDLKAYRADQWEQKTRAHAGSDVSDWHDEPRGHALLVCLVRERQVSLRHADRQITKTLRGQRKRIRLFTKGLITHVKA